MRTEVRLAGSGGQGLLLAGAILSDAVGVFEKRHVVQTNSYGPEARGGASKTELVISDEAIDFPKTEALDVLLVMSKPAYEKYIDDLKPEGVLIIDSTNVPDATEEKAVRAPITQIAADEIENIITANMVALGVVVASSGVAAAESVEKAIANRVPRGFEELNIKAFRAGVKSAGKGGI